MITFLKEFVSPEREEAWKLIDKYQEREFGEVLYSEGASAILVMALPFNTYSEFDDEMYEGTCSAIIDLMHYTLNFTAYDAAKDKDFYDSIQYNNLEDMINKLLKPMADGKITEEDFKDLLETHIIV